MVYYSSVSVEDRRRVRSEIANVERTCQAACQRNERRISFFIYLFIYFLSFFFNMHKACSLSLCVSSCLSRSVPLRWTILGLETAVYWGDTPLCCVCQRADVSLSLSLFLFFFSTFSFLSWCPIIPDGCCHQPNDACFPSWALAISQQFTCRAKRQTSCSTHPHAHTRTRIYAGVLCNLANTALSTAQMKALLTFNETPVMGEFILWRWWH